MQEMKCLLCKETVFSELGNGCRMCGMVVDMNEDFCSSWCENEFGRINEKKSVRMSIKWIKK